MTGSPASFKRPHRMSDTGQHDQFIGRLQIAAGDMRVQHPVPVQKDGFQDHAQASAIPCRRQTPLR